MSERLAAALRSADTLGLGPDETPPDTDHEWYASAILAADPDLAYLLALDPATVREALALREALERLPRGGRIRKTDYGDWLVHRRPGGLPHQADSLPAAIAAALDEPREPGRDER